MKVKADEALLFTFQGSASLHKIGCLHLARYSSFNGDGSQTKIKGSRGVVSYENVQEEVSELLERGYKVSRASCTKEKR